MQPRRKTNSLAGKQMGGAGRRRLRRSDQGRSPSPRPYIGIGNVLPQPGADVRPRAKEQRPWGSNRWPKSTAAEHRSMMVSAADPDTSQDPEIPQSSPLAPRADFTSPIIPRSQHGIKAVRSRSERTTLELSAPCAQGLPDI